MKPSDLTDHQVADVIDGVIPTSNLEREDTGPGKFEGNENPGLAAVLYDRSLQGWNEDETGSVEWDRHFSLLGRFLLAEDGQGFVYCDEYDSRESARGVFDLYDDEYATWNEDDGEV